MYSEEDVLHEALMKELHVKYTLTKEEDVYPFFFLRNQIVTHVSGRATLKLSEWSLVEFGDFILKELHIEVAPDLTFQVDNTRLKASAFTGTTYRDLLENLFFRFELMYPNGLEVLNEWSKTLFDHARKRVSSYKNTQGYTYAFEKEAYSLLHTQFKTFASGECGQAFTLRPDAPFRATREEGAIRELLEYERSIKVVRHIPESVLEKYLFRNLTLLEEGLKPIETQVMLEFGRIDILARDKHGQDVIIEVKVESDTDIVWQRAYYESDWKKQHGDVRMMIVTTEPLNRSIKDSLILIGGTEVFEVELLTRNREIIQMYIMNQYVLEKNRDSLQTVNGIA